MKLKAKDHTLNKENTREENQTRKLTIEDIQVMIQGRTKRANPKENPIRLTKPMATNIPILVAMMEQGTPLYSSK